MIKVHPLIAVLQTNGVTHHWSAEYSEVSLGKACILMRSAFRGGFKGQVWTRHSSCACLHTAFISISVPRVFHSPVHCSIGSLGVLPLLRDGGKRQGGLVVQGINAGSRFDGTCAGSWRTSGVPRWFVPSLGCAAAAPLGHTPCVLACLGMEGMGEGRARGHPRTFLGVGSVGYVVANVHSKRMVQRQTDSGGKYPPAWGLQGPPKLEKVAVKPFSAGSGRHVGRTLPL